MRDAQPARKNSRSLAKGIAAGLVAGLAGAIAMTFAERAFPHRAERDPEPPEFAPAPDPGHALIPATDAAPATSIHWGLGALAGAAYGAVAEFVPAATANEGASFGMTVGALTRQGALSALGVAVRERNGSAPEPAAELASFAVYGVTTEWVRRLLRKFI